MDLQHPTQTALKLLRRWAGPLALTTTFLVMTAWSWRKWPDLVVDFGRELYTPWQLAQGKVLYLHIANPYGPLSPYLNAWAFQLFGVSIMTLTFCNLLILAGMVFLIYQTLARACDRLTATVACLFLLLIFAFSQYTGIGSKNFISPYSHQATHGMALTIAMIWCLDRLVRSGKFRFAALAGFVFGLIFLTKAEIWAADLVALSVWTAGAWVLIRPPARRSIKAFLLFASTACLPLLGFFLYFLKHLPAAEALRAMGGAWVFALNPAVVQNYYYRHEMGLDELGRNLLRLLKMGAGIFVFLGAAAGLDYGLKKIISDRPHLSVVLSGVCFGCLLFLSKRIPWLEIPRGLPLLVLTAGGSFVVGYFQGPREPELGRSYLILLTWAALALALLGKIMFRVGFDHYGFYLAMPAALILTVWMTWFIPKSLASRRGGGILFRGLILAGLAAGAVFYLQLSRTFYIYKTLAIGKNGDTILGYGPGIQHRDPLTAEALTWIERMIPKNANLAVLPEGVMLNYLSRRPSPTPYINLTIVDQIIYGEDTILRTFQAARPDYMVLFHQESRTYGVGYFGADPRYGKNLMDWIRARYEPILLVGNTPLLDQRFGIKFYQRRQENPTPSD